MKWVTSSSERLICASSYTSSRRSWLPLIHQLDPRVRPVCRLPEGHVINLKFTPATIGANSKPASDLDDEEGGEEDELAQLKQGIERMRKGSDERKMAIREWRRMKRIPTGSAENGVVRGYVSPICDACRSYTVLTSRCSWNGSPRFRGLLRLSHPLRQNAPTSLSLPTPGPN